MTVRLACSYYKTLRRDPSSGFLLGLAGLKALPVVGVTVRSTRPAKTGASSEAKGGY